MPLTLDIKLKIGGKRVRTTASGKIYERDYYGTTNQNATEGEVEALLAAATTTTLAIGDPHPDDAQAFITELVVEADDDNRKHFNIQATWERLQGGSTPPAAPLDRDPEIRWGNESDLRPIFKDFSSPQAKPIVNSAGERFDELLTREFGELTLSYVVNVAAADFDVAVMTEYQHVINDAPFDVDGYTVGTGKAKLEITDAPKITEGATTYYRVSYFFRFKKDGWNPTKVLDVGYNQLDLFQNKLFPITDTDGMPIRTPYPLDGSGGARPNPTDPPAELAFKGYEEKDFSIFGFI